MSVFGEGKINKVSHLARFGVPEKVGPVGVCLHLAKDEELSEAKIDHPRGYLCCGRIMLASTVCADLVWYKEHTSSRSS